MVIFLIPHGCRYISTMLSAAGVLPIAFDALGVCHFLVGDDVRGIGASDFGGKADKRLDRGSIIATAAREFNEETLGIVMTTREMERRLVASALFVDGATQNGNTYRMFIVEVPFDTTVPSTFERASAFLESKNLHRSTIEKLNVKWLLFDELMKTGLRSVFKSTLEKNIQLISRVGRSGPGVWHQMVRARPTTDTAG